MLIATQSKSIEGTAKYFDTVLTQGDYYTGAEVPGSWNGKAAEALGLEAGSEVTGKQFKAMLAARHPITGEKLAQRIRKDRRPGIDLTFSVPKSVSLAWAINGDERLLDAIRETVRETMAKDIEPLVCRRVRKGEYATTMQRKRTGNLVYADFLHKTSRPVDGKADPHLHVHAFVLNYTSDQGAHYAAELEEVFRQRPSLQAMFDARLASRLQLVEGYAIEQTRFVQSGRLKAGWELKGVGRETIEKFSNRTRQIEEFAIENDIRDAAEKGKLGAKTRDQKLEGTSVQQLRQEWWSRLTAEELAAFEAVQETVRSGTAKLAPQASVEAAVRYALDHHLYRQSTVEKHEVIGTALEHSLFLSPEAVEDALAAEDVIQRSKEICGDKRDYLTTREVLEAESRLIAFARDGRGTRRPIGRSEHTFARDWLNESQKEAVRHVLRSTDTVTAVTGGAGTGKSSLMQEAAEAIEQNGKRVLVFAPSTGAREVLEEKGFQNAQTVEHLLRNDELQNELKDQVLWIDEAGLLDVRSLNGVFAIAKQQNARVVLSGDTRQHASPRRGEAMRLLESEAGLNAARIDEIQRQKGRYRRAVELVSLGETVIDKRTGLTGLVAGFDLLDKLGKVVELKDEDRHQVLADRYMTSKKQSNLVVAPSHAEGREVTAVIRERLRAAGAVGSENRDYGVLRSLNLSEAQKGEVAFFDESGTVVQFHQNVKGNYRRGERYRVCRIDRGIALRPIQGGPIKPIPHHAADRFEVYREQPIELSVGDRVRFTLGGKSADGKRRISNGRLDVIERIKSNGELVLKSGVTVAADYGHLDLGYVVTSHASQGKDRDVAIAAIGSQSLPAVNAKQFYVTVSRGREDVVIYVDDKQAIRRAIQQSGEQLSATALTTKATPAPQQRVELERSRQSRRFLDRIRGWWRSHAPAWKRENAETQAISQVSQSTPELGRS